MENPGSAIITESYLIPVICTILILGIIKIIYKRRK